MRPEPIGFHCPRCGAQRANPAAKHPADGFISIYNQSEPKLCDGCSAGKCMCHAAPRERLMADGHRPFCPWSGK